MFDPRITEIPADIAGSVKAFLGVPEISVTLPSSGISGRTFFICASAEQYVLRIEKSPGPQLRRSLHAQSLAARAGVMVPNILLRCENDSAPYFYFLEEFKPGGAFPHRNFDDTSTRNATIDLGKNLRKLHTVEVGEFGLLQPHPWINFSSAHDRYLHELSRATTAMSIAKIEPANSVGIQSAFRYLATLPSMTPKLCKGDCRGSNILCRNDHVSAIIDWEWAKGDIPSSDVGYWHLENDDERALDFFIEGYEPRDADQLRREVAAQIVVTAVSDILVHQEHANILSPSAVAAGISLAKVKLSNALSSRLWE